MGVALLSALGIVAVVLGAAVALLYRRVGRFETRVHDRFDYVNRRISSADDRTIKIEADVVDTAQRLDHVLERFRTEVRSWREEWEDRESRALDRLYLRKILDAVGEGALPAEGETQVRVKARGRRAEVESLPDRNKRLLAEEIARGETRLRSYPVEMTLGLTARCNVNPPCGACERNLKDPSKEFDLSPKVLARLAPVLPHVDVLYLHCGGEPLYSRYFSDVLAQASAPTKIRFNTGGLLLDEPLCEEFLRRGNVDLISVSLDAATPETHEKLRGPGFEKILKNLRYLKLRKEEESTRKPTVWLNMCITAEALEEIPRLVDVAVAVGADAVQYFHLNTGGQYDWRVSRNLPSGGTFLFDYKAQQRFDAERHDALLLEASRKAREAGIEFVTAGTGFVGRNLSDEMREAAAQSNERAKLPGRCRAPWDSLVVDESGLARVCCFHDHAKDNLGDLSAKSFDDIWNSQQLRDIRAQMYERPFAEVCLRSENVCTYRGRA